MSQSLSSSEYRRRLLLIAGVVLFVVVVSVFAYSRSVGTGEQVSFSTFSTAPDGTKALYMTLDRLGYQVSRRQRGLAGVDSRRTLFIVEPILPLTAGDRESLRRCLKRGGRVVWVARRDFALKGAVLVRHKGVGKATTARISPSTPLRSLLGRRGVVSDGRFVTPRARALVHVGDKHGALLVSVRYGRGEFVALGDSELITNHGLRADPENLRLVLGVLGHPEAAEAVVFDEWHHGFFETQMRGGDISDLPVRVWRALPLWVRLGVFQLVVLAMLWLYSDGRRLGPPLAVEPAESEPGDYVAALADIYRRAGARTKIMSIIYEHLLDDIAGHVPGGRSEAEARVINLAKRRGLDADGVARLLLECGEAADAADMTESDLVAKANALALLRKELRADALSRDSRAV